MRPLALLVSLLLLVSLSTGCKSPCVQLAEKVCECLPRGTERDQCNRQAADQARLVQLTPEQEEQCEALLDRCDCTQLNTIEGKQACGWAREP
ncbi:MAG: hypothetical protein ACK4N5_06260 [Myxococcales bacterium]